MQVYEAQSTTISYVLHREKEIREIYSLLILGQAIEYSVTDNWVRIGKKVFNGFNREDIRKILESIKKEEKVL